MQKVMLFLFAAGVLTWPAAGTESAEEMFALRIISGRKYPDAKDKKSESTEEDRRKAREAARFLKIHSPIADALDREMAELAPEKVFDEAKMAEIERMFPKTKYGEKALASFRERKKDRKDAWTYFAQVDATLSKRQRGLLEQLRNGSTTDPAPIMAWIGRIEQGRRNLHRIMRQALPQDPPFEFEQPEQQPENPFSGTAREDPLDTARAIRDRLRENQSSCQRETPPRKPDPDDYLPGGLDKKKAEKAVKELY